MDLEGSKVAHSSSFVGMNVPPELSDWLETIPPTAVIRYYMDGSYHATWVEEIEEKGG